MGGGGGALLPHRCKINKDLVRRSCGLRCEIKRKNVCKKIRLCERDSIEEIFVLCTYDT